MWRCPRCHVENSAAFLRFMSHGDVLKQVHDSSKTCYTGFPLLSFFFHSISAYDTPMSCEFLSYQRTISESPLPSPLLFTSQILSILPPHPLPLPLFTSAIQATKNLKETCIFIPVNLLFRRYFEFLAQPISSRIEIWTVFLFPTVKRETTRSLSETSIVPFLAFLYLTFNASLSVKPFRSVLHLLLFTTVLSYALEEFCRYTVYKCF